jgi:UDP-N-acetylmuramoylalanine--D-glutamate ligase
MQHDTNLQQDALRYEALVRARLKMQGDDAHHLETVCEANGLTWINHSMATTVDMTWFALRDVPGPVLLMIGGVDRAQDHGKLKELVGAKVHAVVCMGSTPWKYFNAYRNAANLIVQARDMKEAVDYAAVLSGTEVKTVLFSPSCPSYDAFDNYRNRGDQFRRLVLERLNLAK